MIYLFIVMMSEKNFTLVGRDESGFVLTQPWGSNDSVTPAHLEFSTWKEFNDEFHATFYSFRKIAPIERSAVIKESLEYAIDLHRLLRVTPTNHMGSVQSHTRSGEARSNWVTVVSMAPGGTLRFGRSVVEWQRTISVRPRPSSGHIRSG